MLHELRTAAVIHATSPERGMENYFRFYKMESRSQYLASIVLLLLLLLLWTVPGAQIVKHRRKIKKEKKNEGLPTIKLAPHRLKTVSYYLNAYGGGSDYNGELSS